VIVQFRKGNTFGVAIKLFVFLFGRRHLNTLRPQPLLRSLDIRLC
jgi:hypothetical protein